MSRPVPHALHARLFRAMLVCFPRPFRQRFAASITDANVYALLSAAKDVLLLTISSSVAIEARHFGHDPRVLHPAGHAPAPFISLSAHRSATFWRALLAPLLPLKPDAAFEEPTPPDRLRRNLGAWGFLRKGADPVGLSTRQ